MEEAKCGKLEPENTSLFIAAINEYIVNLSLMAQQGQSGYDFAKRYFDREYLALQYLSEIQKELS